METQPQSVPPSGHHSTMQQMEDFFELYLHKKAPALPVGAKEFIVNVGPWITLIVMLLAIPVLLFALGIYTVALPFAVAGGYHHSFLGIITGLITLAGLILEAIALPGLFRRSLHSWKLVYYAALLSAIGSLVSLNIVGAIIGLIISMYVLFQVREYYK